MWCNWIFLLHLTDLFSYLTFFLLKSKVQKRCKKLTFFRNQNCFETDEKKLYQMKIEDHRHIFTLRIMYLFDVNIYKLSSIQSWISFEEIMLSYKSNDYGFHRPWYYYYYYYNNILNRPYRCKIELRTKDIFFYYYFNINTFFSSLSFSPLLSMSSSSSSTDKTTTTKRSNWKHIYPFLSFLTTIH